MVIVQSVNNEDAMASKKDISLSSHALRLIPFRSGRKSGPREVAISCHCSVVFSVLFAASRVNLWITLAIWDKFHFLRLEHIIVALVH